MQLHSAIVPVRCPDCGGRGRVMGDYVCRLCQGHGFVILEYAHGPH
jgi:DnaJ-class molecular chaperone